MTDVFAKGIADLKLPDFAGDVPALPKLQQPTSLDILREAGVVGQNGSRRSIDIAGDLIRLEKQLGKTGAASDPLATIPSWQQAIAGIQGGYENLPYEQQKQAHDAYVQRAVAELSKLDTKTDPLLLEQKVREQVPAPVKPKRSGMEVVTDPLLGLGAGLVGLAATAAAFGEMLSPVALARKAVGAGQSFEATQWLQSQAGKMKALQSAVEQDTQKQLARDMAELKKQGYSLPRELWEEAKATISNLSIGTAAELAGGTIPSLLVGGGVGTAAARAGIKKALAETGEAALSTAAKKAIAKRAAVAATGVGVAVETVTSGGEAASQTYQTLSAPEMLPALRASSQWASELRKAGGDERQAQENIARDAARVAGGLGAATAAALSLVPGSWETLVGKVVSKRVGSEAAGEAAKQGFIRRLATSATVEGLTEVAPTVAANVATGDATDNLTARSALEGAGGAFALGALIGAPGALVGRGGADATPAQPGTPIGAAEQAELSDEELAAAEPDAAEIAPGTTMDLGDATLVMGAGGQWAYVEGSPTNALADGVLALQGNSTPEVAAAAVADVATVTPPAASTEEELVAEADAAGLDGGLPESSPVSFADDGDVVVGVEPASTQAEQDDALLAELGAPAPAGPRPMPAGVSMIYPPGSQGNPTPSQWTAISETRTGENGYAHSGATRDEAIDAYLQASGATAAAAAPALSREEVRARLAGPSGLTGAEASALENDMSYSVGERSAFGQYTEGLITRTELQQRLGFNTPAAASGRDTALLPPQVNIDTILNGNRDSRITREDNLRWYFQPGAVIPTDQGQARVEAFTPATGGRNWSARVQEIDASGAPVGAPRSVTTAPTFGQVAATFAGITAPPVQTTRTGTGSATLPQLNPTPEQTARPQQESTVRAMTGLQELGNRVERLVEAATGIMDPSFRGVRIDGPLATALPSTASREEKIAHFHAAMQFGIAQLNEHSSREWNYRFSPGSPSYSVSVKNPGEAAVQVAYGSYNSARGMDTTTTGFSGTNERGTEDSLGGRFYDVYYGSLAAAGLKPYLGGLTRENVARMPINRLRAMLKYGTALGYTRVRNLLSPGAAGRARFSGYQTIERRPDAALMLLLQNRVRDTFGANPVFNSDGTYTFGDRTMTRTELRTFAREAHRQSPDEIALVALVNAMGVEGANQRQLAQAFIDTNLSQGQMLFDIEQQNNPAASSPTPATRRINARAELRKLTARYQQGRITEDQFIARVSALVEDLNDAALARRWARYSGDRVRGADWLQERLIRARRTGELDARTVELGLWLIEQNPGLTEDLGISVREGNDQGAAGVYNPAARLMTLFQSANPTTAVHEILHHSERMMPAEVQEGIVESYKNDLNETLRTATTEQRTALLDLIAGAAGDRAAHARAITAFQKGVLDYDKHYQFANASEYWAVNATDIMAGRHAAQGSWIARAKLWLTQMIQRVRSVLGLRSKASIYRGLQAVLNGNGERLSPRMLAERMRSGGAVMYSDINVGQQDDGEAPVDNDDPVTQRRTQTSTLIDNMTNGVPAAASTPGRGFMQALKARNYAEAWKAAHGFGEWINKEFHDASVEMKRWLQTLPEGDALPALMKQRVIGSMYTARKKRDEVLRRFTDDHWNGIDKAIIKFAKKRGISTETAERDIGYLITAKTIPARNAFLLRKRLKAIEELQQQVDDALAAQQTAPTDDMVPAAQAAADAAPMQDTKLDELQAQLSFAQRRFRELVAAINSSKIKVVKHGGGGVAGMNNAQAKAMIDGLRAQHGDAFADMEAVANRVYDANAAKLVLDIESGKATPAQAAEFLERPAVLQTLQELRELASTVDAQDKASVEALAAKRAEALAAVRSEYVPLSGDPTKDIDDDSFHGGSGIPNVQRDYGLEGRERGTPPDNGLATSRAALMKSASYYGWRDFQDGIAAIHRALTTEQRQAVGIYAETLEPGRSTLSNKAVVRHRNGKTTAYVFTDEKLIDAIRGASRLENNALLEMAGNVTKWYSYLATQANPFFAPFNFLRDSWERSELVRTRVYLTRDGSRAPSGSIARGMLKNLADPALMVATARYALGKTLNSNSKFQRYLDEFLKEGGVSAFHSQFSADRAKVIAQINKQKAWRQQLGTLGRWIATYNKTFDVGPALASYIAMREQNMTAKDAAAGALDLMDFGKRGNSANVFSALYAFAQPTFTGAANIFASTLHDPVTGKMNKVGMTRLTAYVAGMLMLQAFLRSLADDDEGGNKLDQQSDFTKNGFLLIPVGDGMIKVPIAYGMPRIANGIARAALDVSTNEQSVAEATGKLVGGVLIPAFSPIEDSDIDWFEHPAHALMTLFSPSWMKPSVAIVGNMTPFGSQVVKDQYGDSTKFRSDQFGKYSPEFYKDVAVSMRKLIGVDMAPEEVRYLFRAYPTGVLQLGINGPLEDKSVGEAMQKKVYANYSEFARYFQFKKAIDETDELLKRAKAGESVTDPMERRKLAWRLQWDEKDKELRSEKGKATRAATKLGAKPDALEARFGDVRMAAQVRALYNYRAMQGKTVVVGEPPDLTK